MRTDRANKARESGSERREREREVGGRERDPRSPVSQTPFANPSLSSLPGPYQQEEESTTSLKQISTISGQQKNFSTGESDSGGAQTIEHVVILLVALPAARLARREDWGRPVKATCAVQ
jgi:hypothetical protein